MTRSEQAYKLHERIDEQGQAVAECAVVDETSGSGAIRVLYRPGNLRLKTRLKLLPMSTSHVDLVSGKA